MKYHLKLAIKLLSAALSVWLLVALTLTISISRKTLYETHTSTDTKRPVIKIFLTGFLDGSFTAYRDRFLFDHKIGILPSDKSDIDITNQNPRTGEGTVTVDPQFKEGMYEVKWSKDGDSIAIIRDGWYVLAKNFRSGETIRYQGRQWVQQQDKLIADMFQSE